MTGSTTEPKRYRVTAPYIVARSPSSGFSISGTRRIEIFGYNRHAILPSDVAPEQIEHLLNDGLIEEAA